MVQCIRDCNDCADVCLATARIISRFTRTDFKLAGAQLRACIQACQSCGAECAKHGEVANALLAQRLDEAQSRATELLLYRSCHHVPAASRTLKCVRSR